MSRIENKTNNPEVSQETLIKEVEKVPNGDILTWVFKTYTIPQSRQLEGKKIYGKIQENGDSPVMVLSLDYLQQQTACLEIFRSKSEAYMAEASIKYHGRLIDDNYYGDIKFIVGRKEDESSCGRGGDIEVKFNEFRKGYSLRSEYDNLLIKIVGEVYAKFSQISGRRTRWAQKF